MPGGEPCVLLSLQGGSFMLHQVRTALVVHCAVRMWAWLGAAGKGVSLASFAPRLEVARLPLRRALR